MIKRARVIRDTKATMKFFKGDAGVVLSAEDEEWTLIFLRMAVRPLNRMLRHEYNRSHVRCISAMVGLDRGWQE